MMNILNTIFGFLIFVIILLLLAAPYALVILFPDVAEYISLISPSAIPWIVILSLCLVFNENIKLVFESIATAISRVRRISAVGAIADLDRQDSIRLTPEEVNEIKNRIESLTQKSQQNINIAQIYYLRYILVTIYHSQYELLLDLQNTEVKTTQEILPYYNKFVSKAPEIVRADFNEWLNYLLSNALISHNIETSTYNITELGKLFINEVNMAKYDIKNFPY